MYILYRPYPLSSVNKSVTIIITISHTPIPLLHPSAILVSASHRPMEMIKTRCLQARLCWARILVQVTIYRRLLIGRDGHLDQSEAYDIS